MKRTFKLNGEVSPEANEMLVAYCKKHERSKGYLLEKMIRKFCAPEEVITEKGDMQKAARSKPKKAATYPSNLDEQFELLWDTKGKKGAKNGTKGAYSIFKKLAANVDDDTCETFTRMLMDDIIKNNGEVGYPELHLTTYLNQQRWVR